MIKIIPSRIALACLLSPAFMATAQAQTDQEAGFKHPPKSAKPHTWWHWINGNISKPGITADLEAMKHFGLAGAQIFNVDVGIPAGSKPFMSPQWKDAIGWAFHEAKRLGLEIDIHNGAGWSSSGGPWVTPAHSMQALTWSETSVIGPVHFDGALPQPAKKMGYYEDIGCYAVRKPANDSFRVANIKAKAAFERGDRISPDSSAIPTDAATPLSEIKFVPVGPGGHVSINLPDGDWTLIRMGHTPTGAENEPSPKSGLGPEVDKLSREALDQFWSGMMATAVKANGPVSKNGLIGALIDSYEVGSQNWTPKFREEFMKRRGYDPMPYLVAVTGRVVGSGDATERFLWDVRRTVCDLFADNYYGYMVELCHRNGLQFSTEGYGNGSFDNLQINGLPDVPMAEFWVGGGAVETTKMVSSSAHTHGKRVVGAESFTADDQHAKWLYDPYSLKALGDQMFSLGINRYIFHRYALQPWLNVEPGMTMGPWGTNFDRTITWWDQGRAWIKYVSRCQFMLQAGRFAADLLVFEGDDGPNDLPLMKGTTVPQGYDYDGCDAKVLWQAHVEHGQLVLPSGMRYRLLVLPDSPWMTAKTARKVNELVKAGAVVLGPKPKKSPTLADRGAGDAQVAKLGDNLWGGHTGNGKVLSQMTIGGALKTMHIGKDFEATKALNWIHRTAGKEDIYFVANPEYRPIDVDATFRVAGRQPELWNPETGSIEKALAWKSSNGRTTVPLRLESAGSVFVVFRNDAPKSHLSSVRWLGAADKASKPPVISIVEAHYDAIDGTGGADVTEKAREIVQLGGTGIAASNANFGDPTAQHAKQLRVVYTLNGKRFDRTVAENETMDFVQPQPDDARPTVTQQDGKLLVWRPGKVELESSRGHTRLFTAKPTEKRLNLAWNLSFPPKKGAPAKVHLDKLISWPESKIDGVKYFSGTAVYRTSFDSGSLHTHGAGYWLDLGKVKNFAEVTLNGHAMPTLWKAPFRLDVTPWLRQGANKLEVRVTNLWPNRLIGDEQFPPDAKYNGPIQEWPEWVKKGLPRPQTKRVTFTTWQFFKKNSPLLESGLIGPVELLRIPEFAVNP
jgi:hypothetical protein